MARGLEEDGVVIVWDDPEEVQALYDYSQNLGGTSFIRRNFFAPMSEEEARAQLDADLARARDPDENPLPIPVPPPVDSTVRMDDEYDRRSPVLRIEFESHGDPVEFSRQIEEQEARLNRMLVTEYIDRRAPIRPGVTGLGDEMLLNRAAYLGDPEGMRRISEPLQRRAREEYARHRTPDFRLRFPFTWEEELRRHMDTVVALHNPDMIAGGDYASVVDPTLLITDRIGAETENDELAGTRANSSMGSGWRGSRSWRLQQHAMQQAANGCQSVQVDLDVCESVRGQPGVPRDEVIE